MVTGVMVVTVVLMIRLEGDIFESWSLVPLLPPNGSVNVNVLLLLVGSSVGDGVDRVLDGGVEIVDMLAFACFHLPRILVLCPGMVV